MSALELIQQVKALPSRERQKFVFAILSLAETDTAPRTSRSHRVKWPDVAARARRIFGRRKLPNLVLLEREEENC
jgi:hypothetical protein